MGTTTIAFGPEPIDDEDKDAFFERWIALFAKAVSGTLSYPRYLPLREYFYK